MRQGDKSDRAWRCFSGATETRGAWDQKEEPTPPNPAKAADSAASTSGVRSASVTSSHSSKVQSSSSSLHLHASERRRGGRIHGCVVFG